MKVTTVGIDVAKSVFQVHGVDERGRVRCAGSYAARRWCCCLSTCWGSEGRPLWPAKVRFGSKADVPLTFPTARTKRHRTSIAVDGESTRER